MIESAPIMDDTFRPWLKYPPLTRDRLSIIATMLRDIRQETVAKHEPDSGDTEWSLGCRVYSRSCFALTRASADYEWLTILPEPEGLRFSFAIGNIPLRFYKGNADDPPGKYMETTSAEVSQQQYVFEIEGVSLRDVVLRLAVETDERLASRVTLVEMEESGNVTNTYVIPFDAAESTNVIPMKTPPVSLPPVALPTTEEAEPQRANEESRNSDASSR